eukprot:TRINITY_DN5379_c0_g1_i1.p1 TRINITY_DN5379_c0_g1~~TRINITY_DN5379_c0_g1_i1.p1  ORF type:complete len:393 (-),score=59.01 TRINITY_DN5379_c0_g1_i1:36-1214(-)
MGQCSAQGCTCQGAGGRADGGDPTEASVEEMKYGTSKDSGSVLNKSAETLMVEEIKHGKSKDSGSVLTKSAEVATPKTADRTGEADAGGDPFFVNKSCVLEDNDAPVSEDQECSPQDAERTPEPAECKPIQEGTMPELAPPAENEDFCTTRLRAVQAAGMPLQHVIAPRTGKRRPSSEGKSVQAYINSHQADFDRLRSFESSSGWVHQKTTQDGAAIFTRAEEGKVCFKATAEITLPEEGDKGIARIMNGILRISERPKWDDMCQEGSVQEAYPPFYRVSYVKMYSPSLIVSPRDLVILGRMCWLEDGGFAVHLSSTEHPDLPDASGFVRAEMCLGGYIVRPKAGSSNTFRIMWSGNVDPKGLIPTIVANSMVWKQGITLDKFCIGLKSGTI